MNCKIFDFGEFKAMIIGNEDGTELHMQINTSNWYFVFGNHESFDEWDDKESVESMCLINFNNVKEDEDKLIDQE